MVRKEGEKYFVYSEGGRRLSRGYDTEGEAKARLKQIEAFKHMSDEDYLDALRSGEEFEDAEYQGDQVTLNKPFRTPDGPKKFSVYVKNKKGRVLKISFGDPDMEIKRDDAEARANFRARHNCEEKRDRTTPAYWSCKMWSSATVSEMLDSDFRVAVFFDAETRTIHTVRDGTQQYYGFEIGMEPANKVFTVYRSPETIAEMSDDLLNLPIIEDHISAYEDPEPDKYIGVLHTSELMEAFDDVYDATMVVRNAANFSDGAITLKEMGKAFFSLGYLGKLRPHEKYDLEQYDLVPRHMALVDSPRGGDSLTFQDRGTVMAQLLKAFCDEDNVVSMQRVAEVLQSLPEALKAMPLDQLNKLMPMLMEAVGAAKEMTGEEMSSEMEEGMEDQKEKMDGEESEASQTNDGTTEDMEDEEGEKEMMDKTKGYTDADVKAQVDSAIKAHTVVVEKARTFLPANYDFQDKDTAAIMRDAVKTQHDDEFTDAELTTAFKMLKKAENKYEQFGDNAADNFDWNKEY